MILRRALLACAAALPLLAGGCAAALVPVVAGGLVVRQQTGGSDHDKAPVEKTGGAPAAELASSLAPAPEAERVPVFAPGTAPRASLGGTGLTPAPAAPAPAPSPAAAEPAQGSDPYAAFASYAVQKAAPPPAGSPRYSALVDQESLIATPRVSQCGNQPPAVIVDLDPGNAAFDLEDPPLAAPGLAQRLAAIRAGGVTVLWLASVSAVSAEKLYTVLRASGLDPQRTDRLLLLKDADDRKQQRRLRAAQDWCVIAIAGDRRSDFDEVFDYLRDPQGPIARALEPNIGAGWFLAPPPID